VQELTTFLPRFASSRTVNGEVAIIWLGAAVSPQILDDLWGVDDLQNLDTRMVRSSLFSLLRISSTSSYLVAF